MTKPLTTAQCVRWAFHAKAVDVLTTAGFTCLRQFQARTGPDSESFEVWAKDGRTVLLHFYAERHGVELYAQCPGNSWDAMRAALVTPPPDMRKALADLVPFAGGVEGHGVAPFVPDESSPRNLALLAAHQALTRYPVT